MRVLGLGEILWDVLPVGPRLGGAPFNVVSHLRRFGHEVRYVTAVGDDALGAETIRALTAEGIGADFVRVIPGRPTGTADVSIDPHGVPEFTVASDVAWERLGLDPTALAEAVAWNPDAIVYGTLAQRLPSVAASTRTLVQALPSSMRLYDVNLRGNSWEPNLLEELGSLSTLLKLNSTEAEVVAGLGWGPSEPRESFARSTAARFGLNAVCVTRGADVASLLLNGEYVEKRAPTVAVVDTVGSGDAFAAALLDGVLGSRTPADILGRAVALGSFVAARAGALPHWTEADIASLQNSTPSGA